MASERQIAANRENARRSSGPRSSAGKRRSSGNALRHGLSRVINDRGGADIEALARLLVGANEDEETLEHARSAVRAQLDLHRIREVGRDLMSACTGWAYRFAAAFPLQGMRPAGPPQARS